MKPVNPYLWKNQVVVIPRAAEVTDEFKPDGRYASSVQAGIDGVEKLAFRHMSIVTIDSRFTLVMRTIENGRNKPSWGMHIHHTAHEVGLSPFLPCDIVPTTTDITIVMTMSHEGPILARAFPGEYVQPLPWQKSVHNAPGGLEDSLVFWRKNSYVLRRGLVRGELMKTPPYWFNPNWRPTVTEVRRSRTARSRRT